MTSLRVSVTDDANAVVPSAAVILTPKGCRCRDCNMNTPCPTCCAPQRTTTGDDGVAQFDNIYVREYVVKVEVLGHKSIATEVTPTVGAAMTVNLRLSTNIDPSLISQKCGFACKIKKFFQRIF
jgi:hypothetical protein